MNRDIDIIDNIQNIYQSSNSLELLLDFERVIDQLDSYSFKHWDLGELCEGPKTSRYWVTCSFFWPQQLMPDPAAAKRMLQYGIRVKYFRDFLIHARPVKSYDDFEPGTKLPKMEKTPIWIVEIQMPKKLMADIFKGSIELGGEEVDLSDLDQAYDDDLDDQGVQQSDEQQAQDQTVEPDIENGPNQANPF